MPKKRLLDTDIIGHKFGRLLPLRLSSKRTQSRGKMFDCICDCGNNAVVRGHSLRHGVKSCGCIRVEMLRKRVTKHSLSNHPLFCRWDCMISRCENHNNPRYKSYGGRGISVCAEWRKSFKNYYDWAIKSGWEKHLCIDRKDNNNNYSPDNCHFITPAENNRNMSTSCRWIISGEIFESSPLAGKKLGVSPSTIKRWCCGYITDSGNYSPPKKDCRMEKKYE